MGLSAVPTSSPKANPAGNVYPENNAKTISAADLKDKLRPEKVLLIGEAGTGKTSRVISLLEKLALEGYTPEEIHVEIIDLDGGLAELLDQSILPEEYLKSVRYTLCTNFVEVVSNTQDAMKNIRNHINSFEEQGDEAMIRAFKASWIIVDNMMKAWRYPQDDYCRVVYGMSLVEKMEKARASQQAAKASGGERKGEGVFNQQLDYGTITPMHNDWAEAFPESGINFLWLSPWKWEDVTDENNKVVGLKRRFGQSGNDYRVSTIIILTQDSSTKVRKAEFLKYRGVKSLPKDITDISWEGMFAKIDEIKAREAKARDEEKRRKFADILAKRQQENTPAPTTNTPTEAAPVADNPSTGDDW